MPDKATSQDLQFRPDDGTPIGDALGLLNDLLRGYDAPTRHVAVFWDPRFEIRAQVHLADEHGAPADPPGDLVALRRGAEAEDDAGLPALLVDPEQP